MSYRIFHWDTFDDETIEVGEATTIDLAIMLVFEHYGSSRLRDDGADRVDIVDEEGNVVKKYYVR